MIMERTSDKETDDNDDRYGLPENAVYLNPDSPDFNLTNWIDFYAE